MSGEITWQYVALAALNVVQLIALAWINRRGVVLPPTNRRARNAPRPRPSQDGAEGER